MYVCSMPVASLLPHYHTANCFSLHSCVLAAEAAQAIKWNCDWEAGKAKERTYKRRMAALSRLPVGGRSQGRSCPGPRRNGRKFIDFSRCPSVSVMLVVQSHRKCTDFSISPSIPSTTTIKFSPSPNMMSLITFRDARTAGFPRQNGGCVVVLYVVIL